MSMFIEEYEYIEINHMLRQMNQFLIVAVEEKSQGPKKTSIHEISRQIFIGRFGRKRQTRKVCSTH